MAPDLSPEHAHALLYDFWLMSGFSSTEEARLAARGFRRDEE